MSRFYFDAETDGLLRELTRVHSLVLIDADTGTLHSFRNDNHPDNQRRLEEGVRMLMEADEIIGHNIINFDLRALAKVYPWFKPKGKITDTLVLSRLIFGHLFTVDSESDQRKAYRLKQMPPDLARLRGSHSLKAWGYRLGTLKGEYGDTADWSRWTPEMQTYCEQDVIVTDALHKYLMSLKPSARAVLLEHKFATILDMQEHHGFVFDEAKAVDLYMELVRLRLGVKDELIAAFPPKRVETIFVPKVNNKKQGYVKGVPFTKVTYVDFNPSSRQMIADRLIAMGWEPENYTPSGQPKVDETVLSALPYPEAKVLARHFLIEKRIGQLAEGDQAWLRLVFEGRIHGRVNPNGAITGRCTHSTPNVAQVPSVKVGKDGTILWGEEGGWGAECRSLFTVRKGYRLVGVDLSGLELRCLGHFMARYDGGAYIRELLEGDIHRANQLAAGLPTRNDAKTFIYAYLYGAGDAKIGSIVLPDGTPEEQAKVGKKLKAEFLKKTPALKKLKAAIDKLCNPVIFKRPKVNQFSGKPEVDKDTGKPILETGRFKNPDYRGYLIGLDGRRLPIRSAHSALNTLLQSAGALIAKLATVLAYEALIDMGLEWGKDFAQVAHVHDEMQFEVRAGLEETVGKVVVEAMAEAGRQFNFNCPVTGEAKWGVNWQETH